MEEYKYDRESVDALIAWAKSASFPKEVRLSEVENIKNVPRFVKADLVDIKKRYRAGCFHPAVERLYRLKALLGQ